MRRRFAHGMFHLILATMYVYAMRRDMITKLRWVCMCVGDGESGEGKGNYISEMRTEGARCLGNKHNKHLYSL